MSERGTPMEEAGGGAAALRLEKRTNLNTAKYRITLRNYGDGLAEIGWSFISSAVPQKAARGQSAKRDENELRAIRRARSRMRHLILAANADHLLTLTYRENMIDFERSCADLTRFLRLMRVSLPGWAYIARSPRIRNAAPGTGTWLLSVGRMLICSVIAGARSLVKATLTSIRPKASPSIVALPW